MENAINFRPTCNDSPRHYRDLLPGAHRLLWAIWDVEYRSRLSMVKKFLGPFKGQKILDAGCGDGRFCYEMQKEPVEMVGVDVSEKMIKFARAFNPGSKFYVADIANWKPPNEFDQAVAIEVLEHIPPHRLDKALFNISTALRENGKLIVTVPSKRLKSRRRWGHFQHFSTEGLKKTLGKYFRVEKIYGHSRMGLKKTFFDFLRIFGCLLYLPSRKVKFFRKYFVFLENYFKLHLEICNPEKGERLIAICTKL